MRRLAQVLRASVRVVPGGDELLSLANADRRVHRGDHDSDQRVFVHGNRGELLIAPSAALIVTVPN